MVEQSPAAIPRVRPRRSFASGRAILALILREMATSYGRSPLGYLWAILEPLAGIALLTLVFSALVRKPPLGDSFPIFYATGIVPFMFYGDISNKVMASLGFSRQLLVYPSVTFVDAILARFLLAVLTQCTVAYCLFTGMLMVFDARVVLDVWAVLLGISMAISVGLGVGVVNCFLTGMSDTWRRIWAIINRPLFLISCTFFLYDSVPEPYRGWLWYNPLVHVIGQVRSGFYPYYEATYVSVPYVLGLSFSLTAVSLLFLRRYYLRILQG